MIRSTLARVNRILCVTLLWIIIAPWGFIWTGAALNQVCLIANWTTFPVMSNVTQAGKVDPQTGMMDRIHVAMSKETHLNFLGDIFFVGDGTESVGDILLNIGEWMNTWAPFVWAVLVSQRLLKQASDNNET
jgi:hypothetical protein